MSVVNQMLRDLDRRQTDPSQPVFAQHIGRGGASKGPLVVVICVLIAALAACIVYLLQTRNANPAQTPLVAIQTPPAQTAPITVTTVTPVTPIVPVSPVIETPPAPVVEAAPPPAPAPAPALSPRVPENAIPPSTPAATVVATPPAAPIKPPATPVETRAAPVAAAVIVPTEATPAQIAPKPAVVVDNRPAQIDMRPSALSAQSADGEYRRAIVFINQARESEARAALATALKLEPRHEAARQTLAVLLIENGMLEEAEGVLTEGLRLLPAQSNFAMVLARVKVERGDSAAALAVLKQYGAKALDNAQYRGFTAALLQRAGRHNEAIDEYRAAVALVPAAGAWWMGLGISYEAAGQRAEALEAFTRARETGSLSGEVAEFVDRKLQILR